MKLGVVFPGQGSQRVGMGTALAAEFSAARRTFDEASEALGYDMLALCANGPEAQLVRTEYTQPAILTVSVAAYRVFAERGAAPAAAAGHSLGEFSALVAAGMLAFGDAVRLVRTRGRAMQQAVPEGQGKMAAVLGLEAAAIEAVCAEAAQGEVVAPANFNAPGQIVVSGHTGAVDRAGQLAKARGAKRVVPLDVSAPFHCALMAPAARELEQALAKVAFMAPAFTVIANVDGRPYAGDAPDARRRLTEQVCAPVRWEACVRGLGDVSHTLECGPGKVVSGLVKRVAPQIVLWNLESPADLAALAT